MNLPDIFNDIQERWGLDRRQLKQFAVEDKLLGEDKGNEYGTAYSNEGHLLYALIRLLKPLRILEIGTYNGGSASHMAAACKKNGQGKITTVDISSHAGKYIARRYRSIVTTLTVDANLYIPTVNKPFDFIFEDGAHSEYQVHVVYQNLPRILNQGGFILSHDILMNGVGQYIKNGMVKGGVDMNDVAIYEVEPSPCGMSVYQYTGERYEPK